MESGRAHDLAVGLATAAARLPSAVGRGASRGQLSGLLVFLGVGLLILVFLFLTVHNRKPSAVAADHPEWSPYYWDEGRKYRRTLFEETLYVQVVKHKVLSDVLGEPMWTSGYCCAVSAG